MTVAAILKNKGYDVATVRPDMRIEDLARLLTGRRIGAVVVQDSAETMLGIISERDVIHAISAHGEKAVGMTVDQFMTRQIKTATPRTTVDDAMTIMSTGRFRHLPVMEHGALLGIVSIGDVVKARISQQAHEVDSLKAYVAGAA